MSGSATGGAALAARAAAALPGPGPVADLAGLTLGELSRAALVDVLVAAERQVAWLHSLQVEAMAGLLDLSPVDEDGVDREWVREDVACALRLSALTASNRLAVARELRRLPRMRALLADGLVSFRQAQQLAESVLHLDDAAAGEVENRVVARAPEQSPAAFARAVQRAVLAVDGRRARQRHRDARERRRVVVTPVADGMAEVWALLPAEGAAALSAAIDRIATRVDPIAVRDPGLPVLIPGDARTADQRRADALVQLGHDALDDGAAAGGAGRGLRPAVQVTVALSTLLGLDEQPGELAGHGPIPAELARRLADDPTGTWRRLVTDDLGGLLDLGRTTYRPPTALARTVVARDQTCRFPNCHRRADRCDLDHHLSWEDHGPTSEHNLGALCRRHHRAKHVAAWRVRRTRSGDTRWLAPTGHTYRQARATLPVDVTYNHVRHGGDRSAGDDAEPPPF